MVMWVFGYGSLIWKAGFNYDQRLVGFIKGYRRVFYQGSTDHRGTPDYPGRVVTLERVEGEVCWGVAYKICGTEEEQIALTYLEVREKQYDKKVYVDFFTDPLALTPAVSSVMVYIASPDRKLNPNYLGPASLEEIAKQIILAEGPSGPNRDYIFQLERALIQFGIEDKHVIDIAKEVRRVLSENEHSCNLWLESANAWNILLPVGTQYCEPWGPAQLCDLAENSALYGSSICFLDPHYKVSQFKMLPEHNLVVLQDTLTSYILVESTTKVYGPTKICGVRMIRAPPG